MDISLIQDAITANRYRITDHAVEEAVHDGLALDDILFTVEFGEIIEDDPHARPYSRCLIYGLTRAGEAVHSVWAYNRESGRAALVTVYRPDPQMWIDGKLRRT